MYVSIARTAVFVLEALQTGRQILSQNTCLLENDQYCWMFICPVFTRPCSDDKTAMGLHVTPETGDDFVLF